MITGWKWIALCAVLTCAAFAQDRGTIRGMVSDASGAAVADTTVTVKNQNTGLTQVVKTNSDGRYTVLYLPVGDYSVTAEKTGFRKAESTGIHVNVGSVVDLDVALAVGGVEQTIDVSATTPLVETQGSNLGQSYADAGH
jgi:Bacterial Ig-like domain (group 1).